MSPINIFKDLTPESCYWAGFIAADGCIYRPKDRGPSLEFCLAERDVGHLERFCRTIEYGRIKYWTNNIGAKSVKLKIGSVDICNSLEINFGIMERKTFTLEWPELTLFHERHFIRGFYDGDGSLKRISTKKSKYVDVDFNGRRNLLVEIRRHLMNGCSVPHNAIFDYKNISRLSFRNSSGERVLSYLKQPGDICLQRKYL